MYPFQQQLSAAVGSAQLQQRMSGATPQKRSGGRPQNHFWPYFIKVAGTPITRRASIAYHFFGDIGISQIRKSTLHIIAQPVEPV